jgi:hypothetical protein
MCTMHGCVRGGGGLRIFRDGNSKTFWNNIMKVWNTRSAAQLSLKTITISDFTVSRAKIHSMSLQEAMYNRNNETAHGRRPEIFIPHKSAEMFYLEVFILFIK